MPSLNFKELAEFIIYQTVKTSIHILPRKFCLLLGRTIGSLFYYLDRRHRRTALSNLNIAFGAELSPPKLKMIAINSFKHFGELLMDTIKLSCLEEKQRSKLVHVEGEENLHKSLSAGKGVILFSGHYGNWEIGASILSKKGHLHVIARPLDNKFLERELLRSRTKSGVKVIYKYQATKQMLRILREKEMVAFLIDQNVLRSQAVFVDFFGKKAATTPGLAAVYLRTQSPLVPAFCFPTPYNSYKLKILSPLNIPLEKDYHQNVLKITQICTKIIEAQIRDNPAHWLWFHNRWKTRPDEDERNINRKEVNSETTG